MPSLVGIWNSRAPGTTAASPVTASGQLTAGAIGAVIADTGALPAGVYDLEVTLGFSGVLAAGKHISLEHRNAANGANVQQYGLCPAGAAKTVYFSRIVVAANERIRAIIGPVAGGAGEVAHATIRAIALPN